MEEACCASGSTNGTRILADERVFARIKFYWLELGPPSLPKRRVIRPSFFFRVLSCVSWLISPAHCERDASNGRLGEPSGLKK